MKKMLTAILLVTSIVASVEASVFTEEQEAKVIEFVQHLIECRGVVGMTVGVVKDNETWTRGFGKADRETGTNVTSSTLFGIGSVTKAFTSAILSLFVNETGKYRWSTPVADILGQNFKLTEDDLTRQVTLKDLLTHRTGLDPSVLPLFSATEMDRAEYIKRIRFLPVKLPFRDEFDYNNWMYTLAGRAAEVMGGATWEELLETRLLKPLGMTDSKVLGQSVFANATNFARPYISMDNETMPSEISLYRITPHEAAGAIASSADDMVKWMQLLLNNGQTAEGVAILEEAMLREMTSPLMGVRWQNMFRSTFPAAYVTYGYGLGWFVGTYRGYPVVSHTGGFFAYTTFLALMSDLNLGIFISTNGLGDTNASRSIRQVYFFITDLALGKEPWLNLTNACLYPELWQGNNNNNNNNSDSEQPSDDMLVENPLPDFEEANKFAGSYGNSLFGDVRVSLSGSNGLLGQYGALKGRLYRTEEADDVGWLLVEGPMEFIFRREDKLMYLKFRFWQFSKKDGKWQRLTVSMPDDPSMGEMLFDRGVKFSDPITDGDTSAAMSCWWPGGHFLRLLASFLSVSVVINFRFTGITK